jgi:hypothetical protein
MTPVELIISCGVPQDINRTVTQNNENEQWVYLNSYAYVENGKVTSFQD